MLVPTGLQRSAAHGLAAEALPAVLTVAVICPLAVSSLFSDVVGVALALAAMCALFSATAQVMSRRC